MKNIVLLIVFFVGIGIMANVYFIPNLETKNNIDLLGDELEDVAKIVPRNATLYYIPNDAPNEAEIRYKAQFVLAPRVIVLEKSGIIPKGSFMIKIRDKNMQLPETKNDTLLKNVTELFSANNYFNVALLIKK